MRTGGNQTFYNNSAMGGNGSTIFIASKYDNVYRSTDNGDTWQVINNGLPRAEVQGYTLNISPQDICVEGTTVFLADGGGLYRSLNNGNLWAQVCPPGEQFGNPTNSWWSVVADGSTVLAYSMSGSVWRSTDNGTTWSIAFKLPAPAEGRFTQGNGIVVLATRYHGVYYSHDNGATWRFMQGSTASPLFREIFTATATATDLFLSMPCYYGWNCNGVYKIPYTSLPLSTETFSLNGNAGTPNALVRLTSSIGATQTTLSDASGAYSFAGLSEGAYTVLPTLTDHVFSPTSANVRIAGSNLANVNFTARAGAPASAVNNFAFTVPTSPLGSTTLTLSWNAPPGGAAGYTVVVSESATSPTGTPQQGDVFTGDAAFNGMMTPPFSGQVVYDGAATNVVITGLTPNTRYTAIVYPYNGFGGARAYFTPNPATASAQTLDLPPPPQNVSTGTLTLIPATLNYGDIPRGTSYTRTYTLSYANLTVANVTLTPPAAWSLSVAGGAFSTAPVQYSTTANVGQVSVRARFTPTQHGTFLETIAHTAGSTSASLRVTGTSSPPSITVSTLTLDFGAVIPGVPAMKAYRVRYRNLVNRSITLTPPVGFAISTTTTGTFSTMPLTVSTQVTGSFLVYVRFTPSAEGKQTGTLQHDNPDVTSLALFIEGEGVYPSVTLNKSLLNFDGVPIGTCRTLSYLVSPAGGVQSQQTDICPPPSGAVQISLTGPNGPFSSNCTTVYFSRTGGGVRTAQVWVRYCPTSPADLNAEIVHTTDPIGLTVRLPLSGFGAEPEISITPATRNFGTLPLNQSETTTLTVQIRNAVPPSTVLLSTTGTYPFTFLDNATGTYNSTWTTSATTTNATYRVTARFLPTAQQSYRTTFAGVVVAQNGSSTDTFTLLGQGRGSLLVANNNQTLNFNGNFLLTPNTRSYVLRYDNITTNTIEVSPTNHPAFLTSIAQNGVFTTTDPLIFTVGGTPANPVSSNVTVWVRFLPVQSGTTTATLFHNSFVSVGTTGANVETLRLSGTGQVAVLNATTATGSGSLTFNDIPLGQTRYYRYTLTYRNVTAANITVNVPAGSSLALADPAQTVTTATNAAWITAGQPLTIPTVPATTANTSVPLWIRFTPVLAQNNTITIPLPHTADGRDPRTIQSDNLNVVITRPPVILDAVPDRVEFGTVAVNGSSTNTYTLRYQNMAVPVTLTLPNGVGIRPLGAATFQTGTFTFTPQAFTGTAFFELRYQPTAAGNLTGNVAHAGGGTSATLQVRGRATSNLIFVATPNPISFTIVTGGTSLPGTTGQTNYFLDVGNATSRTVRIQSLTAGVQILVGQGNYALFGNSGIFTNQQDLTTIDVGRLVKIPITIRARYSGSPTMNATIRHQILDASNNALQTLDVPVTLNFIACPGRVDSISVMVLYTEGARDYLARRLQTISKITNDLNRHAPLVFTNSRLSNLVVKVVNPDGEFVSNNEWRGAGNNADIVFELNQLCTRQNHRLSVLREQLKADVVCVFNHREGPPSITGVGTDDNYTLWTPLIPNRNQSVFAVSVESEGNPSLVPPSPFSALSEAIPYTVLHEMGHLCGGDHNPGAGTGSGNSPFIDGQGLEHVGMRRIFFGSAPQEFYSGTIMYNGRGTGPGTGNGERLPFWSDPATQTMIRSEALVGGVLVTTSTMVTLGSNTQNMRRVMSINGPQMASLYVSTLNPIVTTPLPVVAGQTARIDVTTCEGTEPFVFTWSAEQGIGGAPVTGTISNGGRTFQFTMPTGAAFVRVRLTLQDATGLVSVIERVVEEAPSPTVLALEKSSAGLQSSHEQFSGDNKVLSQQTQTLSFALEQNHPNPCSDETNITLTLPTNEHVRLSLFDALGREVMLAIDDRFRAGVHTFVLDVRSLPTGMYFYHFRAGAHRAVKKMSIVR